MKLATLDLTNSRYLDCEFLSSIKLAKNTTHVFDSFHNSFFETYWFQQTSLRNVAVQLVIQGQGHVELVRNITGTENVISNTTFSSDVPKNITVRFDVGSSANSRIYLKIKTLEDSVISNSVFLETDESYLRQVKLAIIMCTFNKQTYILKNLGEMLASDALMISGAEIFVIDNASNLELKAHEKIHYIPQDNFGGAGGFTRGLIEARKTGKFSHYLFMDDDIALDPDTILRTIALASFSNLESSICGGMISFTEKNVLWELGANFFNKKMTGSSEPCFHNMTLKANALTQLSTPVTFDYGGWWFFCFSETSVAKVGLPIPCFIRGDDVEYGIRLTKNGIDNIGLPGIAVWHEPLIQKTAPWLNYFRFRNYFIIGLLYGSLWNSYKQAFKFLLTVAGNIFAYDYNQTNIQLKALKDVVTGSKDLGALSTPDYKKLITSHLNKFSYEDKPNEVLEKESFKRGNVATFILKFLTFNGHLLPDTGNVIRLEHKGWKKKYLLSKALNAKIFVYNTEARSMQVYQKSFREFGPLSLRLITASICVIFLLPWLVFRYRSQLKQYAETQTWAKFLNIA